MYLYIIVLHIFDTFDVHDVLVVVCVVHIFLMFCSFKLLVAWVTSRLICLFPTDFE